MSFVDYLAYSLLHDPLLTIAISMLGGLAIGIGAAILTIWDRGK